jgi:TIR domain-containing protein
MAAVFISYRRDDSAGQARALFRDLSEMLGKTAVFMDVDSIALGRDFRQALQEHLASCDSMLVLIGPRWLRAEDGPGRRLDHPDDYVRQEIAAALMRNIPVTPVLVQGARIPDRSELPDDLKDLAFRNGFELSHTRWDSDVRELVQRLGFRPVLEPPRFVRPSRWRLWAGGGGAILIVLFALLFWGNAKQWWNGATPSKSNESSTTTSSATPNGPPALELEYAVGTGDVILEIDVGNGQLGSSRVEVDGQVISSSNRSNFSLGRGDTLVDKVLSVATVVSDVNAATNKLGVHYRLSGGPDQFSWTVSNPSTSESRLRTFRTATPADCTALYGTYDMTLTLSSGAASCDRSLGSRWTFSGNTDCSNFKVIEAGSNITFHGTISSSGKFKATGSGATIEGGVTGNQIIGTDTNSACAFTVAGKR